MWPYTPSPAEELGLEGRQHTLGHLCKDNAGLLRKCCCFYTIFQCSILVYPHSWGLIYFFIWLCSAFPRHAIRKLQTHYQEAVVRGDGPRYTFSTPEDLCKQLSKQSTDKSSILVTSMQVRRQNLPMVRVRRCRRQQITKKQFCNSLDKWKVVFPVMAHQPLTPGVKLEQIDHRKIQRVQITRGSEIKPHEGEKCSGGTKLGPQHSHKCIS